MALSFDSVAADALWIRYIHEIPSRPAEPAHGRWLASYLDAIVDLDPHFKSAYIGGVTLLAVLGNQPCSALRTAEIGTRYFPDDWRVHFQAGYLCFDSLADTSCAARHMRAAAALPEKPPWLPGFVARLLSEDKQVETAIEYLQIEIRRTEDPRIRSVFEERLREARLTRDLDALESAARSFRLERGAAPASLEDLVATGYVDEIPREDPFGGRYAIDLNGRILSTSGRGRLKSHRIETIYDPKNIRERLFTLRVEGRRGDVIGRPMLPSPLDRLRTLAGDVTSSAQAVERLRIHVPYDAETDAQRLQWLARILLRHDVDGLRAAHVAMLRERPGWRPSILEVAARAGVPSRDPVGDEYLFGEDGLPTSVGDRQPMVSTYEDRHRSAGCR